jgi:hypothetical protein
MQIVGAMIPPPVTIKQMASLSTTDPPTVLEPPAENDIKAVENTGESQPHIQKHSVRQKSIPINLGEYRMGEVQLCIMGSRGPEGEYVSCGSVDI